MIVKDPSAQRRGRTLCAEPRSSVSGARIHWAGAALSCDVLAVLIYCWRSSALNAPSVILIFALVLTLANSSENLP